MPRQSIGPWIFLGVAALAVAVLAVGVYRLIPSRKGTESRVDASAATPTELPPAPKEQEPAPRPTKPPEPPAKPPDPPARPPDPAVVEKQELALTKMLTLTGHFGPVNSLAFTASWDEPALISGGQDGSVRRWTVPTGKPAGELLEGRTPIQVVFAHPTEKVIYAVAAGRIHAWKSGNHGSSELLNLNPGPLAGQCFSGDGRLLALGNGSFVRVYDPKTCRELSQLRHAQESVLAVAISHDGRAIASAYPSGLVQLWDGRPTVPARPLPSQKNLRLSKLALAPKLNWLAGAGDAVHLWEVGRGAYQGRIDAGPGGAAAVAFTPDGRWLCFGASSGRVVLYDLAGKKEHTLFTAAAAVHSLAFSPDGKLLAAGTGGGTIHVQPLPPPVQ